MDIHVDTRDVQAMAHTYESAGPLVRQRMTYAMTRSVIAIEADAKRLVPTDTHTLQRSLTHEVHGGGETVIGRAGSNLPYARIVEEGRTPGAMPPQGVLLGWMSRHGIPESAEFVIRRAINRHKRPRPYLKPAFEKNRAAISKEFDLVLTWVMQRIGGR